MSASSSDSSPPSSSSAGSLAEAVLNVEVNGEGRALPAPSSVSTLLEILELAGKRVAVAVNRAVVVRSRYAEVELAEGDRIEILEAVGGG
jgi:sulfur carrier protein